MWISGIWTIGMKILNNWNRTFGPVIKLGIRHPRKEKKQAHQLDSLGIDYIQTRIDDYLISGSN